MFLAHELFMMCPNMVKDDELMMIWRVFWRKNAQWLFKDRVPAEQVKNLFDDHVAALMTEEAKALEVVFQFTDWDDQTEITFLREE